jgi:sugar lactone lactonase YvrE
VLIDRAGSVVTGLTNGDVVRVSADGAVVLGNTGGRPLGIEEYPDGNLLVCDHDRGLLRLDVATGEVQVLLDEVDGKHLHFCSNAVICADGTIYFSSSSDTATWQEFRADVINHASSGRSRRKSHGAAEGPRLRQRSRAGARRVIPARRRNDRLSDPEVLA